MPIHRRGITLADALLAAAAYAPLGRAMLYCYELSHPSVAEPIRFVDNKESFSAALESTAPFNPSSVVEFMPLPLSIQRPEESDSASAPEVVLSADNVSGVFNQTLKAARGSLVPWTIIERLYASDDTTGPCILPVLKYELSTADIQATQVRVKASYGDPVNVSIPSLTFKREEYPGLTN